MKKKNGNENLIFWCAGSVNNKIYIETVYYDSLYTGGQYSIYYIQVSHIAFISANVKIEICR